MKMGVFSAMHYLQPAKFGQLFLHSSANAGAKKGGVTLFFGLSGTGKTALSADPNRQLICDDEHVWSDNSVSNIEGGCYTKRINLSAKKEPEIYEAIRFGSVLENAAYDVASRKPDYDNVSIAEIPAVRIPLPHRVCSERSHCQQSTQEHLDHDVGDMAAGSRHTKARSRYTKKDDDDDQASRRPHSEITYRRTRPSLDLGGGKPWTVHHPISKSAPSLPSISDGHQTASMPSISHIHSQPAEVHPLVELHLTPP